MRLATLVIAAFLAAQAPSADAVIAKMDSYLESYEPQLSSLIADELLIQEINSTVSRLSSEDLTPRITRQRRRLASEVAFVALPHDAGWRVEFAEHKNLGLLVPTEMRETFPVVQPAKGTGVAKYSNFRRFQTSARIVPQ
jgi:hypothetical protein